MKATVVTVLILGALAAAAYLGLAWSMQRRVIFPQPPLRGGAPRPPAHVRVEWVGPRAETELWVVPPLRSTGPSPVLLFAHGNGELIDDWIDAFEAVRGWGVGVALVEYPGYGRSGGRPSQESVTEAMVAAYDLLARSPGIDGERIVGYGRSLGGGAIGALSAERELSALIIESSFTSTGALASRFGLPSWLVRDPFDNLSALSRFVGPVLVIHGARDELIPVAHGIALAEASGVDAQLLACGHNDCPRPWPLIRQFLEDQKLLDSPSAATR